MNVSRRWRRVTTLTLAAATAAAVTAVVIPASAEPVAPAGTSAGALTGAQIDVVRDVAKAAKGKPAAKRVGAAKGFGTAAEEEGEIHLSATPFVADLGLIEDGSDVTALFVAGNSSGELVWRFWYSDLGWSAWERQPGGIKGAPAVVPNPVTRTLDFYVDSGGDVWRAWLTGDHEFGVEEFGGRSVDHAPTAFLNPNNGNVQVYATSGGRAYERYQSFSTGSWSGWSDLGVSGLKSSITPYYNPAVRNIQLYGNAGDKLVEKWWRASDGWWSPWTTFSGRITGSPVTFFNPHNRNTSIFVERDGDLVERYWSPANGKWSNWGDFNGAMTGRPAVLSSPVNKNQQIYVNSGGKVFETYWRASDGKWFGWSQVGAGAAVKSDPVVVHNSGPNQIMVFAVDRDGQLAETHWTQGQPWSAWKAHW